MNYVLAIFSNRSHTIAFSKYLKRFGIPCHIISTPRELSASCGISVRFNYNHLSKVSLIINQYRLTTFKNFYLVKEYGMKKSYKII